MDYVIVFIVGCFVGFATLAVLSANKNEEKMSMAYREGYEVGKHEAMMNISNKNVV